MLERRLFPGTAENQENLLMVPCVYMLASGKNGTLYIGVTSNLSQRIWQHKAGFVDSFTSRYKVHALVWYEVHGIMESAITREKKLKKWNRAWKISLIEQMNPQWDDLCGHIV